MQTALVLCALIAQPPTLLYWRIFPFGVYAGCPRPNQHGSNNTEIPRGRAQMCFICILKKLEFWYLAKKIAERISEIHFYGEREKGKDPTQSCDKTPLPIEQSQQEAHMTRIVHLSTSFWNETCLWWSATKTLTGRGRWDLAFCQFSLHSVKQFQRRSQKCTSQSKTRAVILVFRSARKPW